MSRLGPLHEREFRLLFLGRTISMAGSAMAPVALAFAVLDLTGSTTDLGIVLAARQIPQVVLLLVGGVWADRLPRHHVMVASNVLAGASQVGAATLLLTGRAGITSLALLAVVNGSASAFFFPASSGVVPQTVSQPMLQQANAALRLGLNATNIIGAAIGGVLVAATSPGVAIAVDAASYGLAALCVAAMRLPPGLRVEGSSMFQELREGWHDFWSRTWLWVIVLQFSIVNAFENGAVQVLGPGIAKRHLGGPAAWGGVLTATSIGLVTCGLLMLRWRPHRILFVATLAVFPMALPLIALAIPRLYAYDAVGSFALTPVAMAALGPIASVLGARATLTGCAILTVGATAPVLLSRDVRSLERRASAPSL